MGRECVHLVFVQSVQPINILFLPTDPPVIATPPPAAVPAAVPSAPPSAPPAGPPEGPPGGPPGGKFFHYHH